MASVHSSWLVLLMLIVAQSTGCQRALQGSQKAVRPLTDHSWSEKYERALNQKYADFNGFVNANYAMETSPVRRAAVRNEIVEDLTWLIDKGFTDYKYTIYQGKAGIEFFGDAISLSLNAAGTITGGTQAKTVLAALAGLNTAAKITYDRAYLHEKATSLLFAKMQEQRNLLKTKILLSSAKPNDVYPLRKALDDLLELTDTGSIASALMALEQQVQEPLRQSKDQLNQAEKTVEEKKLGTSQPTTGPTTAR